MGHKIWNVKIILEKKRGALNQQLREKTGLGNDDLLYVTVTDAPKKTPVNMRNGPGPEVHSDPDSDGKFYFANQGFTDRCPRCMFVKFTELNFNSREQRFYMEEDRTAKQRLAFSLSFNIIAPHEN